MAKSEATSAKPSKGTKVAAKAKAETSVGSKGKSHDEQASAGRAKYGEWEIRDAMRTMMRAGDIVKNKSLMGHVRKHAKKHAVEMHENAMRAESLAKSGMISEKAMARLKGKVEKDQGGDPKALAKTNKIATGKEGDHPSRSNQGITYR